MSRFPLEIYLLIIEVIGLNQRRRRRNKCQCIDDSNDFPTSTLEACSLVCRAWYHHAAPFLWVSASLLVRVPRGRNSGDRLSVGQSWYQERRPLGESLDAVLSNAKFLASIQHFSLEFSDIVSHCNFIASPELVSFCKTIGPRPTSLSVRIHEFESYRDVEGETIFSPHFEVMDDDAHPLGQILTSLCHSSALTTFDFEGGIFPFDILKSMPNLKDVSFTEVWECVTPYIRDQPSPLQSLPFCLRRASFQQADSVYSELMQYEETLLELEELGVKAIEFPDDEALGLLLSIPNWGTLKELSFDLRGSSIFAKNFVLEGLSLEFYRNLEKFSIGIHDLDCLITSQERCGLLDILEAAPTGCLSKLKSFDLSLSIVAYPFFDRIFDPEARGWSLLRRLLGPKDSPSLKSLSVKFVWSHSHEDYDGGDDTVVNEEISAKCLELAELCMPAWRDDARGVERTFKVDEPSICNIGNYLKPR